MLPLGDAWTGVCRAIPGHPFQPGETSLEPLCNLGYARGRCAHFPANGCADAARFIIVADEGAVLRLYYVLERDHRPFAHGPLEFSVARGELTTQPEGALTSRQARAYAASYLQRWRPVDHS